MILWSSRKQHDISRSNIEAEYQSLAALIANILSIRRLLDELHIPIPSTPMLFYGNLSVVLLVANPVLHSKSKHFELDLHFIHDHLAKGRIQVSHIPSHAMIADVLTKPIRLCLIS